MNANERSLTNGHPAKMEEEALLDSPRYSRSVPKPGSKCSFSRGARTAHTRPACAAVHFGAHDDRESGVFRVAVASHRTPADHRRGRQQAGRDAERVDR